MTLDVVPDIPLTCVVLENEFSVRASSSEDEEERKEKGKRVLPICTSLILVPFFRNDNELPGSYARAPSQRLVAVWSVYVRI